MKVAYKRGYDWIWMMDDDAIPENDTLEKLLLAVGDSSDVIARPALTNNPNQFTPWFAGGIFSRSVISRIGLPWRELFIHWDDVEYAMRAEKNGIKIVNVKDTKIYHKDWTLRGRLSKRVLGKTLSIPLHPKGKKYYYIQRNKFYVFMRHKKWKELFLSHFYFSEGFDYLFALRSKRKGAMRT